MKFKLGDATDTALCMVLKHEFLRCDDAFNEFTSAATRMILDGDNRRISYKAFNAYARFVHHLYEFMLGAFKRDREDTSDLNAPLKVRYINGHVRRILKNRRDAILRGNAPSWENRLNYYPEQVPSNFGTQFRRVRNVASGHVLHERSSLSLSGFYEDNHKYIYLLYHEAKGWWGRHTNEFPDLGEVTAFSVLVKNQPAPTATR
jgi:hypothetical protein